MKAFPINKSDQHQVEAIGYSLFVSIGWVSVLVPTLILTIEHFFHRSDAALGAFYAATALTAALGSFGCGLATERFGRRIVTPAVALLLGLGLIGQALTHSWVVFFIAAMVANLGAGAIDGGINGLFLDLHASGRTGGALNMLHLFFSAGAVVGAFIIGLLVNWQTPWQAIIGMTGVVIALFALVAATLPLPSGKRTIPEARPTQTVGARERSLVPFVGLAIAICLYVGAELGVTSWVVKYVAQSNIGLAVGALSMFWGGITLGRLLSSRTADRFHAAGFAIACLSFSTVSLVGAVLSPNGVLSLILYGLTGVLYGPIFPMIMVIGSKLYPHRIAVLSGSLSAAAATGAIVYPGLMGFISVHQGIKFGMLGAAFLAALAALALLVATTLGRSGENRLI